MVSAAQERFLVSDVDFNLFLWIFAGEGPLPAFDPNAVCKLKALLIRPQDTGGGPDHVPEPFAEPQVKSEWTVHCMESPHDKMERLHEKQDPALVRYGLMLEITKAKNIEIDQKELQERSFPVTVLQTSIRCGRELADRVSWSFGIRFPIGKTALADAENAMKRLCEKQDEEKLLMARGFETFKSGQVKPLLFREPLNFECPEGFSAPSETPVLLALQKYWGFLSQKNGQAILGWTYVAQLIQKFTEPSWNDETLILEDVPRYVLLMFRAADELVTNFDRELGLSKKLMRQFEVLRNNLIDYIEKEERDPE
jgi:hypothetical protein